MPASRSRRTVLVVLLSLLPTLALATASRQNTEEFTLDNGLKLVVREDHRAPVAVVQLWYRVGSSLEAPGATGLSHALEHLMFKGSRKLDAGEASHLLRDLGAEENAFTTDDYTVYYQCSPATACQSPWSWKPIACSTCGWRPTRSVASWR